MADQLVNEIYGLGAVKLSEKAKEVKRTNPTLTNATRMITNGVFWSSMALLGKQLSDHLGCMLEKKISSQTIRDVLSQTVGYTSLSIHPMLVSLAKNIGNFRKGVDEMFKPGIRSYAATFTMVGPVGSFLFISAMSLTSLAAGAVGIGIATVSATLAWAAMVVFEYPAFKLIWAGFSIKKFQWKGLVLPNMEKGTWKDVICGFAKTFDAKARVRELKKCDIPKTASEYVGQLFGISISAYYMLLPVRIVISGTISALYALSPKDFVNQFMLWSGMVIGVLDPFFASFTMTRAQSRIDEIEKTRTNLPVV